MILRNLHKSVETLLESPLSTSRDEIGNLISELKFNTASEASSINAHDYRNANENYSYNRDIVDVPHLSSPQYDLKSDSPLQSIPLTDEDKAVESARAEYEAVLKLKREQSLKSLQQILNINTRNILVDKQKELDSRTKVRSNDHILSSLTEIIETYANLICSSRAAENNEKSHHVESLQTLSNRNLETAQENNQGRFSKAFPFPRNTSGSYWPQETAKSRDFPLEKDTLPKSIEAKIREMLDRIKHQQLSRLEAELHQEAILTLEKTKEEVEERKRYWSELAKSDALAAHNLKMQEASLTDELSVLTSPSESALRGSQTQKMRPEVTSTNSAWKGRQSRYSAERMGFPDDRKTKLFSDSDSRIFHSEPSHFSSIHREDVRFGGRRVESVSQSVSSVNSWDDNLSADQDAHANVDRKTGSVLEFHDSHFYLNRARRGAGQVLLKVSELLERAASLSNAVDFPASTGSSARQFDHGEDYLDEDDDALEQTLHRNQASRRKSMPDISSGTSERIDFGHSEMTLSDIQPLSPSALTTKMYETVSILRQLALKVELAVQKNEKLHQRLLFEFNSLKSSPCVMNVNILLETSK